MKNSPFANNLGNGDVAQQAEVARQDVLAGKSTTLFTYGGMSAQSRAATTSGSSSLRPQNIAVAQMRNKHARMQAPMAGGAGLLMRGPSQLGSTSSGLQGGQLQFGSSVGPERSGAQSTAWRPAPHAKIQRSSYMTMAAQNNPFKAASHGTHNYRTAGFGSSSSFPSQPYDLRHLGSASAIYRARPAFGRTKTITMTVAASSSVDQEQATEQIKYPCDMAPRGDAHDFYGSKAVADPYRALENPDAPETKAWVDQQNAITEDYLSKCELRGKIADKLTEVWDYPKIGLVNKHGSNYYFLYNSGLSNQSTMYKITEPNRYKLDESDVLKGAEVFLDPNQFSEDGTAALGAKSWSEDGKHLAYQIQRAGSDWATIYVRSAETGQDLEDELQWIKFSSIAWTHDNKGFFYSRFDAPASLDKDSMANAGVETDKLQKQQVWYHRLGTSADQDVFIYDNDSQPDWMFSAGVTNDGRYLTISAQRDTSPVNLLYLVDLETPEVAEYLAQPFDKEKACPVEPTPLVEDWIGGFSYIHNKGPLFYFKTNHEAPFSKVIEMNIENPGRDNWKEIIPESKEKKVLKSCTCANGQIVALYMENAADKLRIFDLETPSNQLHEVELPDLGTVGSIFCKHDSDELFFLFTSFTDPGSSYHVDMNSFAIETVSKTKLSESSPDISNFVTDQIWYKSKDGTEVPMFVVRKKSTLPSVDQKPEKPIPTILYGYGGFNVPITPSFSPARLVFLNNLNGMLCVANIRGGGEFGEDWHKDGIRDKKQNGLDDFIAAAEFIQKEKGFTDSQRTIINGGSNGGTLVTAVSNQRPDLFGAVVGQVPVTDMLRFQKFTIGHFWIADYGCSEQDGFDYLIKYSPLHNIKKQQYPATMILTGDHDDRVVPLHTYKYVAELQHTAGDVAGQRPLLARVDVDAGHGAGMPTSKIIAQTADVYSFASKVSGAQWSEE